MFNKLQDCSSGASLILQAAMTGRMVSSFQSGSAGGMIFISLMALKLVHFVKEGDERIKCSPRQPGCKLGHEMQGQTKMQGRRC